MQRGLVLRSKRVVTPEGARPATIHIRQGKIERVGDWDDIETGAPVSDVADLVILPGLVDSHVHLRNYHIQDYLYWGVTTVGDLGNSPGWLTAYRDAVEQGRATGSYILNGGNRLDRKSVV